MKGPKPWSGICLRLGMMIERRDEVGLVGGGGSLFGLKKDNIP